MNILHTALFAASGSPMLGVGFHNVGSEGVLRASNEAVVKQVQHYYGERCGHLPLNSKNIRALVDFPTADIYAQMKYLSGLFGKNIIPVTFDELKEEKGGVPELAALVVPYINVPEIETRLHTDLSAESWGLPGKMTHVLKNKASFYHLVDEFALGGFRPPEYSISTIANVAKEAGDFLSGVEDLYKQTEVAHAYPLGVMLRAAESDGN